MQRLLSRSIVNCTNKFRASRVCLFRSSSTFLNENIPQNRTKEYEIVEIIVPNNGFSKLKLNKWKKQVGEQVGYGDLIVELEHDNLAIDIYSERRGILKERLVGEGTYVNCGDVVSYLEVEKMNEEEISNDLTSELTAQVNNREKRKLGWLDIITGLVVFGLCFPNEVYTFLMQIMDQII